MNDGRCPLKTYQTLKDRYAAIARNIAPAHVDAWVDEARPFLESTARAMHVVSGFSISSSTEPVFDMKATINATGGRERIGGDVDMGRCGEDRENIGRPRPVDLGLPAFQHAPSPRRPVNLTVLEAVEAIRKGVLSPVQLVEACLNRIDETDDEVRAWSAMDEARALKEARRAEKEIAAKNDVGPIHGVPFGVKDNMYTAELVTTGGSRLYENFVPSYDADVVALLRRAGAIVIGKTTTAEMALGNPPKTRNPWNRAHTPGGSSSGSAAAVAAGHVPFTLATQTGGSLNRPAGYCGLVAGKPTFGRVSRRGLFPVAWTLDHVGIMTRNALDQAFMLRILLKNSSPTANIISRIEPVQKGVAHRPLSGVTVGRPDRYFVEDIHPDQRRAYEDMLHTLEEQFGMVVRDVTLPPSFEAAASAHTIVMQCEAAAFHMRSLREKADLMGPALRSRLLCGYATGVAVYVQAQRVRNTYVRQIIELFHDGVDIVATPTTGAPAPKGIAWSGSSAFNAPWTMTGFPTIVFPTGFEHHDRLPLSAQLIAPPFHEHRLLDVAVAYQQVTDRHDRRPSFNDTKTDDRR